jgi:hypothetical protein
VLFITGYSEVFTGGSGLLDEGMQVLTKPFSLTPLRSKCRALSVDPTGGSEIRQALAG